MVVESKLAAEKALGTAIPSMVKLLKGAIDRFQFDNLLGQECTGLTELDTIAKTMPTLSILLKTDEEKDKQSDQLLAG